MVTRSQKIRLGIFIIISIVATIAMLIAIVAPKFLEVRDIYYIGYRDISVTGLQLGSPVKYHGLSVGYVNTISIDTEDIRRVIVKISLDRGTPIKEDTYADITALGITGLMLIELRGGTNTSKPLSPGGFIVSGKSFTELITGRAEIIAEKLEMTLNNIIELSDETNRKQLRSLIGNTSNTMEDIHHILTANNDHIAQTLAHSAEISAHLSSLSKVTLRTMENLEAMTRSDTLHQIFSNLYDITKTFKETDMIGLAGEFNIALKHTNRVLREIDAALINNRADLGQSIRALKESADYLNEFSRLITEDPSILVRGTKPKDAPDTQLEK